MLKIAFKGREEANIYIYIYIYCCFRFKKSEQPQIVAQIVALNRIIVNYTVHFLFYLILTIVRQDTKICNGTTKILVKVGHRFSCFYRRKSERKQYLLGWCLYN